MIKEKITEQNRIYPFRLARFAIVIVMVVGFLMLLIGALWLSVQAGTSASFNLSADIDRVSTDGTGRQLEWHSDGEVEGEILRKPSDDQGIGGWLFRSDRGIWYWIYADENTEFAPTLPEVGQRARAKYSWEFYQNQYWAVASKIELRNNEGNGNQEDELEGILIAVPIGGIGAWVIQTGLTKTVTINVSIDTRLDDGVPPLESWVEVRGEWQGENAFNAIRVREDDHELHEVIARLDDGVISSTVAARYNLRALSTLLASGNIHLFASIDDDDDGGDMVEQLMADADVVWAELNFTGGIPERYGYKTWRWGGEEPDGYINHDAFAQVNLAPVLTSIQGEGITIALLDTGVALGHEALRDRLLPGFDVVDDDAVPNDDGDGLGWGHGTHIAGIIAKMSPQSKLLPIRVLDTNGRGNTFTLAYAIEWAVAQGADVINLSLGAEDDSQVLRGAIQYALDQGVIVVAAAGNISTDSPQFPASYPGVLSVTAIDGQNVKAEFAAYGEAWVDLAAPGVGITSTIVGPLGRGYASWSGTSMATGFVSGAAALLRQQEPTASIQTINERFTMHATNVDSQNPDYIGQLGGLLDVAAALEMAATEVTPTATSTAMPTLTPLPTVTPTPIATPTASPTRFPTPTSLPATSLPPTEEPLNRMLYLPFVSR